MTTFQTQLFYALGNKTKILSELKKVFVRPLIQTVKTINQEYIEEGILDRISQKYNVSEEIIDEYYSIIFTILKIHLSTLSQNVKPIEFKQILEELRLSPECIDDLSIVVYGQKRSELISGLIQKTKFYPHLISCKWRIDITISSSVLNRVLEPYIIMEWTFNNGKRQIFELSLPKFHQLRHAIATILVEMQKIEKQCAAKNIVCS
ncbi:COMM domain-containing protein 5-like isoform X2 [Apis dorsata]|uniref:COMM domain-containing protein 5-like isoform X2 n=1 Tax=Apis dorsata TaxID=7462 RepID=UPI001293543E|nr:COMM domain-containing protein 5-like isoform X2 [Apis dorsata]